MEEGLRLRLFRVRVVVPVVASACRPLERSTLNNLKISIEIIGCQSPNSVFALSLKASYYVLQIGGIAQLASQRRSSKRPRSVGSYSLLDVRASIKVPTDFMTTLN